MDIKTVYGFILLGISLATAVVCKKMGIDGDVQNTIDLLIAAALLLISGKELSNISKRK